MSKNLFKRTAATGAAIAALGFTAATSLPASAATARPAAQSVQAQHQARDWGCGWDYYDCGYQQYWWHPWHHHHHFWWGY